MMLKGVILSIMASLTFGVLYFYTQLLGQLDSEHTFGWRIIATLPFLTLFMWWSGDLSHIKNIYQRILAKPSLLLSVHDKFHRTLILSGFCLL
ncbi:hypothetical protein ACOUGJ_10325, partial [Acinetobacter baumannii]